MTRSRRMLAVLLAVLLLAAAGIAVALRVLDDDDAPSPPAASAPSLPSSPSHVAVVDGTTVVTVDAATQRRSGIRTETLPAVSRRAETPAYATAVDLQPLLDLRSRINTARAESTSAAAAARASRAEFDRTKALYEDDRNASLKALQSARAAWTADDAKRQATDAGLRDLAAAARQRFGATVAQWAAQEHSDRFDRLAARRETLLRVVVPASGFGKAERAPETIDVETDDGARRPAHLVSPSAQADPSIPGAAFLYRVDGAIPAGARLAAFVPASAWAATGVVVPARAIVWYGGQPWAYAQAARERFARRRIAQDAPAGDGFFVVDGIRAGEPVVVTGAQLLLSEELKPAPSAVGCKDAECDD